MTNDRSRLETEYAQHYNFVSSSVQARRRKVMMVRPRVVAKAEGHYEEKIIFNTWLKNDLGLNCNPFEFLDAGADANISAYLVDQGAFASLWGDWHSFIFAPVGGGKTAYRARLARACRVGEDGRRILPVIFKVPSPAQVQLPPQAELYFQAVNQALAQELLLELAYAPNRFLQLPLESQSIIRAFLDRNLLISLSHLLDQITQAASLEPLIALTDPTAQNLPNLPRAAQLLEFCQTLGTILPHSDEHHSAREQFEAQVAFALQALGYEAVYLLVDGVDAYPESQDDPKSAVELLEPLLQNAWGWGDRRIWLKLFLPSELESVLQIKFPNLLTKPYKVVKIEWNTEALAEVLHQRLHIASGGLFNSFDAICAPSVSQVEAQILKQVRPLPRDVLDISNQILFKHFDRTDKGRLEPEDVDGVLEPT